MPDASSSCAVQSWLFLFAGHATAPTTDHLLPHSLRLPPKGPRRSQAPPNRAEAIAAVLLGGTPRP
jgi:hypothetical protein